MPGRQVAIRPEDEVELLHQGIVEVQARYPQLSRVIVPLEGLAEVPEVIVRGAVYAVREAQVQAGKLRKEIIERRGHCYLGKISAPFQRCMLETPHQTSNSP